MSKYVILYNSLVKARERMENSSQEEMNASMAEWMAWRDEANKVAKFDFGMPLQAVSTITSAGVTDSHSPVSGYSMIEADSKDTVVAILQKHPHLKQDGESIELLEVLPMPGM